jgi:hypothetical protein
MHRPIHNTKFVGHISRYLCTSTWKTTSLATLEPVSVDPSAECKYAEVRKDYVPHSVAVSPKPTSACLVLQYLRCKMPRYTLHTYPLYLLHTAYCRYAAMPDCA